MFRFINNASGQAMLITILALSGTILGATTIAGILTLYQIRQSSDTVNSAKAIFAADTGLEWRLYKFYKADGAACLDCPDGGLCPQPEFTNNAIFTSTCTATDDPVTGSTTVSIKSTGTSSNNARAFEITLQ